MAKIVNFRRAQKAKARTAATAQGAANRAAFGRTKAEKAADAITADRARRLLDGAKRDD